LNKAFVQDYDSKELDNGFEPDENAYHHLFDDMFVKHSWCLKIIVNP